MHMGVVNNCLLRLRCEVNPLKPIPNFPLPSRFLVSDSEILSDFMGCM